MAVTSRLNNFWVPGILVSTDSSTHHIMSDFSQLDRMQSYYPIVFLAKTLCFPLVLLK